jgi:hypothetical protein
MLKSRIRFLPNVWRNYSDFLTNSDVGISFRKKDVTRLVFRTFLNHPSVLLRQLLFSKEILLPDEIETPFGISLTSSSRLLWISREAAKNGVLTQNLDLTLEYDFLRFPSRFNVFIWDLAGASKKNASLTQESLESLKLGPSQSIYHNDNYVLESFRSASLWHGAFLKTEGKGYFPDCSQPKNNSLWPHEVFMVQNQNQFQTLVPQSIIEVQYPVLFVGTSESWFHFLVEIVPRILFALETIKMPIEIVVRSTAPNNIKYVLRELAGMQPIELNTFEELRSNPIYIVQDKFTRSLQDYEYDSEILNSARTKMLSSVNPSEIRKIFLDRKRGLFRPMQNKRRVRSLLKEMGFQIVFPENLDFVDLVSLVHGAEILVGESGAALTNIMFMKPEAICVELHPGYGDVGFWRKFSESFDISYFELCGKRQQLGFQGIASDGFRISVKALRKLLIQVTN